MKTLASKEHKKFQKKIRPYGLKLEVAGANGHIGIWNEKGNRVGTLSASPHGPIKYAIKNTTKQLIKNGCLPPDILSR